MSRQFDDKHKKNGTTKDPMPSANHGIQRKADEINNREKMLQLQAGLGNQATHDLLANAEGSTIQRAALPESLKSGMEHLSGMDLSDVQVHYNSDKPSQMQAHAFARGSDIHLAPGQEKHLPHEAWHTVQQKQGRVKPTGSIGGSPVNDDKSLEREADTMAIRAQMAAQPMAFGASPSNAPYVAQRAALPKGIEAHVEELMDLKGNIEDFGQNKGAPLSNYMENADIWATDTRFSAFRKYEEFYAGELESDLGNTDISFGADTTMDTDVQSQAPSGTARFVEVKVVSGSWPQLSKNVLNARSQLSERVAANGQGIAHVSLSDVFYAHTQQDKGWNHDETNKRVDAYLTKNMKKKFKSQVNTKFMVRVNDLVKKEFWDVDVSKYHV